MRYRGMGRVAMSSATAPNWAGIERFARNSAGGAGEGIAATFSAAARANRQNRFTASLRALADTVAVRPMAMEWLARPANRHREGLIAVADFAAAQARRGAPVVVRPAAVARPASPLVATVKPLPPPTASVSSEALLAQVRAELARPQQQWHKNFAAMVLLVDTAKSSPDASVAFLKRFLDQIKPGEYRELLAVMIASVERDLAAMRATMPASTEPYPAAPNESHSASSPGPVAVGNYHRGR